MNNDLKDDEVTLFNDVYNKYKNIIYYWIKRKVNNPAHYDDIFQEVTMKIHKYIRCYDVKRGSLKNYIRVITFSVINDFYRRNKNSNIILDDDLVNRKAITNNKNVLFDLEHDLTPFEYDLFVSYYVMNMSKKAIAKDFGLKYSTCRNRLKDLEVKLNSLYNKSK